MNLVIICRYELEYEDGEREAAVAQSAILSIGFGCFSDVIADNDDLAPTTATAKNWAMTHPPCLTVTSEWSSGPIS